MTNLNIQPTAATNELLTNIIPSLVEGKMLTPDQINVVIEGSEDASKASGITLDPLPTATATAVVVVVEEETDQDGLLIKAAKVTASFIADNTKALIAWIKSSFAKLQPWFKSVFDWTVSTAMSVYHKVEAFLKELVVLGVKVFFNWASQKMQSIATAVWEAARKAWNFIWAQVQKLIVLVKKAVKALFGTVDVQMHTV